VGDLIGRAFRFYRINIPLVVQVLMWPTVISIAGKVAMQWGLATIARKEWSAIYPAGGAIIIGWIITVIAIFFLTIRQLALVRIANGFSDNFKDAYVFLKARIGTVVLLMLIGYLIVGGLCGVWLVEMVLCAFLFKAGPAMIVLGAVGICVGVFGIFLTALIFWLIGLVVLSVVACEETGLGNVLTRGFALPMRDFGRTLLIGFVLFVTISTLSYPLSLPAVLLSLFEFFRHGMSAEHLADPTKVPMYILVLTQAWESLVNMLLWPVTWLTYGLYYYDLRVRQEGLDVLQNLRLLEQRSAS
jgi:hypothetical protein